MLKAIALAFLALAAAIPARASGLGEGQTDLGSRNPRWVTISWSQTWSGGAGVLQGPSWSMTTLGTGLRLSSVV